MTSKPTSNLPLELSSWTVFAISLAIYWITADPEVSFWDCPEYVTVASRMEIGHPPGNPIWMLAMRMATIPFPQEYHAYVINLCSGVLMAFAAFFLCRLIFVVYSSFFHKFNTLQEGLKSYIVSLISVGASLCFAFCDSAWFSAVEAEVYAMSAFLSMLSLWIMVLWWYEPSKGARGRLLILLAYLIGLSLGVHQLNLLLIPVYALIIFYKIHPKRVNPLKPLFWIILSCALIGIILLAFVPGVLFGAGKFELFSVNTLGFPYNSGAIIFLALLFLLLIILIVASTLFVKRYGWNISLPVWMSLFLLVGFSSFGVIIIRGSAYPPMNEGVPDNIFALSSYISRDQYPSTPLIYGGTPYSRPMLVEEFENKQPVYLRYMLEKGKPKYQRVVPDVRLYHRSGLLSHEDSLFNENVLEKGRGYVLEDYVFTQKLTPELNMWFPRLTSRKPADIEAYKDWAGMTTVTMQKIPVSETMDSNGNYLPRMYPSGERPEVYSYKPTYSQQFRFLMAYQAYYMYFRYLFWNFIGRQNDFNSMGEIEHGNFITGFPSLDQYLGVTEDIPDEIWRDNKGRNRYFGIPFAFGLLGIIWLAIKNRRSRRILSIITLIFLMTGLAIVVYLNQSPGEPRERDYTFLGSYMAFAMWIGAGFACVASWLERLKYKKISFCLIATISLGVPALMATENFDDHDRRGRFQPTYFASSLLDFESPSVIFSHGDNSTFTLWYASEVLNMGPQHTPVDITYLSQPSYIINLKKQGEKGIQTIGTSSNISYGAFALTKIPADSLSKPMPLIHALEELYNSDSATPVFPTSLVTLPRVEGDSIIINLHQFSSGSSYLSFRHLMLLDILASQLKSDNPKVLFFPSLIDFGFYKPLMPALYPTLFGFIYSPWLNDSIVHSINKKAVNRELSKLKNLEDQTRYYDPLVTDRIRRYRGELIIEANEMLSKGDTLTALNIADAIEQQLPYTKFLPGDFTQTDSTFYEGKEFILLAKKLYEITQEDKYYEQAVYLDSIMEQRQKQWVGYYRSLPNDQRSTLSNRSRRLLRALRKVL